MASRFQHLKETCVAVFRAALRLGYICLWLGLIGGSVYGLSWCRECALAMPQYKKPATVRLHPIPSWLQNPGHKYIQEAILSSVKLNPEKDCFADDSVARKVATGLAESKWVEQVICVRKDEGRNILVAECKYSYPTAWIQQDDKCYLIDERGVRLPNIYAADHIAGSKMPIVTGVAAAPPDVGQPWVGEDLQAGIKQAEILPAHIREQIAAIDVSNYTGRKDPQAPDIKLITQERASEILWGHAPGEEYEVELAAAYKVKVLEDNLRRYGRIDGNKAYLDIRTAPVFQPAQRSASESSSSPRAIARADRQ